VCVCVIVTAITYQKMKMGVSNSARSFRMIIGRAIPSIINIGLCFGL